MFKNLRERFVYYCEEKHWVLPLPFAVLFGYYVYRYWGWVDYSSFIDGFNFAVHEFGHVIMKPFGRFMEILGGSLVQLTVPVIAFVMFLKQDEFVGIPVSFGWFATNCFHVATYVADARTMALQLVGLSAHPMHDWHWLLKRMNLLAQDYYIAQGMRMVGFVCLVFCVAGCLFLSWSMFRHKTTHSTPEDEFMKREGIG